MEASELKAWRMSRGLSRDDAAKALGIAAVTFGNYERGDRPIPLKVASLVQAAVEGELVDARPAPRANASLNKIAGALAKPVKPATAVPVTIEPELPSVVTVEPARSVPAVRAQLAEREPLKAKSEVYARPIGFDIVTGEPIYTKDVGQSRHGKVSKKGASE